MSILRIILIFFFTVFWLGLYSQTESFLDLEKDHHLIGDQIEILFILKIDDDHSVSALDLTGLGEIRSTEGTIDSTGQLVYEIPDYEILDYGFWQTNSPNRFPANEELWEVELLNSKKIYKNKVILSFWEPGQYLLKDISYIVNNGQKDETFLSANELKIIITAPGDLETMETDSIPIAPIKEIIKEPILWTDYLIYLYSLVSLALIGLVIYLLKNLNKEKEAIEEEVKKPAHEIALDQLEELERKQLWQNNQVKAYQSNLTHIIREYLENRYDIRALEMTTDEIVAQLKSRDFEMKWKDGLKRILQIADLVKFAKATPPLEINDEFMLEARDFIENTKEELLELETQNQDINAE